MTAADSLGLLGKLVLLSTPRVHAQLHVLSPNLPESLAFRLRLGFPFGQKGSAGWKGGLTTKRGPRHLLSHTCRGPRGPSPLSLLLDLCPEPRPSAFQKHFTGVLVGENLGVTFPKGRQ